jgi:hypothetical protein
MHAMNGTIDLSAADKARLVWKAARVPKCGPLDDKAAETLGKALEWAAQWRINAGSTLPPRQRERLKNIEGHANKLAQLLGEQSGTPNNIERYWPDSADPISWGGLTRLNSELQALSMAAREAQMHRGGAAVLRDRADQTLEGPFVRFVQEASRQFCKGAIIPAGETIKKAIDAEKKRLRNSG